MERLTLLPVSTPKSPTPLEKFCAAISYIIKLPCVPWKKRYDGDLKAISSNLHHLTYLDISYCAVDSKEIEYLLPTEDNTLGGCPKLVELDLWGLGDVDVELLKKIILALPKLRFIKHELFVNALADLTEEEMGVDTARCLNNLYARHVYDVSKNSLSPIRYDILAKSPVFQRFSENISKVYIAVPKHVEGYNESALLAEILMLLPKLQIIILSGVSEVHIHVLPLLESMGQRVRRLHLSYLSGHLSVQDVMKTCKNLEHLTLHYSYNAPMDHVNSHQDQVQKLNEKPVLPYLTEIYIYNMVEELCSAEMLIALLQSPWLNKITLDKVEVLSDDVMFNVLSSPDGTALSKVTKFSVRLCPLITEAPFVSLINRESCSLQHICFCRCDNIDHEILKAATEKYPKGLRIEEL